MKPLFLSMLAMLAPSAAQAAGPVVPDTGAILQQLQPARPPAPSPGGTGLTIEQDGAARLPSSAAFLVKSIRISGSTVFDAAILHALVADAEGQVLTLVQLGEVAARITSLYRGSGYPLARAIIPAQAIRDGTLIIEVVEARYGKVGLDNHSRVTDGLLAATIAPLQAGQTVSQASLDRALLLLSDIPGITIGATLKPGAAVGTSDLMVEAAPGPATFSSVVLDHDGSRYTGRNRIGGAITLLDPLGHGDAVRVNLLSSGRAMVYGRLGYESVLNGTGTRAGAAYSALQYVLGEQLASLDAHGSAGVASLWARQPLVRSRDLNLHGQLQYDRKRLRDHIDSSAIETDRHLDNWTLSLAGDRHDGFFAGGITTWGVAATRGRLGFDNSAARLANAATARTEGNFKKWNASLSRLQQLTTRDALYLAVSGQLANTNLDSSEKMIAGGVNTVRAYDNGAISADSGYVGTVELRHDLAASWNGQWQAVVFADSARVTVNRTPWVAGENRVTLSGAGIGMHWAGPSQWHVRAYLATSIGASPALVDRPAPVRGWLDISKGF